MSSGDKGFTPRQMKAMAAMDEEVRPVEESGRKRPDLPTCPACGEHVHEITETLPSLFNPNEPQRALLIRCEACRARGMTVQGKAASTERGAADHWKSACRMLERALKCLDERKDGTRPIDNRRDARWARQPDPEGVKAREAADKARTAKARRPKARR